MNLIEITDLSLPDLEPYMSMTSSSPRNPEFMVVESPKVIERALEAGLRPASLLCERKHIEGDAAPLIERMGEDLTVFTGSREVLSALTGYTLTRGVLCAMKRPLLPEATSVLAGAKRICVIYDVCEATNVGLIFRTAAALGYDGVLVSDRSCDPLNRRAIRVSMGAVFQIPWAVDSRIMTHLQEEGFESVSMALTPGSVYLQDFTPDPAARYALLLGSEGYGLPRDIISATTHVVKIPMHHNVDSLNVGAAAAIALWHFRS